MKIYRTSPLTGIRNCLDLPVTVEQLGKWQSGATIQSAMPHLNADQREYMMSGYMPGEFDSVFANSASELTEQQEEEIEQWELMQKALEKDQKKLDQLQADNVLGAIIGSNIESFDEEPDDLPF